MEDLCDQTQLIPQLNLLLNEIDLLRHGYQIFLRIKIIIMKLIFNKSKFKATHLCKNMWGNLNNFILVLKDLQTIFNFCKRSKDLVKSH